MSEIEIRRRSEAEDFDFGGAYTPELYELEDRRVRRLPADQDDRFHRAPVIEPQRSIATLRTRIGAMMKFILLMYAEEGAWPPEEHRIALQESVDVCHHLDAKGQYLGASPLQPPSTATCVRVRNGKPSVLDGPYAETKEQLGGYFLIDVANLEEAIAIAARIPGARRGTAEIRPLMEVAGLPALQ